MDRNLAARSLLVAPVLSLSARRAWIEIIFPPPQVKPVRGSLSARRAWIEMLELKKLLLKLLVALRKESVDRNSILNLLNLSNV